MNASITPDGQKVLDESPNKRVSFVADVVKHFKSPNAQPIHHDFFSVRAAFPRAISGVDNIDGVVVDIDVLKSAFNAYGIQVEKDTTDNENSSYTFTKPD